MQVIKKFRRTIAAVLMTAGLAYPACAAVCPKGIGGCTSPGRCFLFVDADGNSLCDYTSRSGSTATQATAAPTPDQTAVQVTVTPASGSSGTVVTPAPDTTTAVIQNTSAGTFFDTVHLSVPLFGAVLFLILAGVLFALVRTGMLGIRIQQALPALALSSFFAMGLSLISTCILAGEAVSGTVFALIYMGAGTVLIGYLWFAGVMNRRIVLLAAAMSTLSGFVFLSPIMPLEIGSLVNVVTGTSALTAGVIVICAVIALALIVGRVFCGSICPVGSLQELAYAVPVKKFVIRHTEIPELVRLAVFAVTVIAAIYLVDTMEYTGLYDLFSLTVSALLIVAAGLVLLSLFLYRPVCRVLCPFGVLFSLMAEFSRFRLHRTESCISCRKCEKACPASTAGKTDPKRECYLCGRCTEICPGDSALTYSR
ncbi:MAG: 4Fe-4S binding protein [Methanoregula sp.]|nr:4Fe-4S binding protein [Methanoregula sp.]